MGIFLDFNYEYSGLKKSLDSRDQKEHLLSFPILVIFINLTCSSYLFFSLQIKPSFLER
jgi:hypothetical protein